MPLAVANFYTEGNLSALREMALREVALAADHSAQKFREAHTLAEPWRTAERVMVCVSPDHASDRLLRRGWRIANMLRADLVAVTVAVGERATDKKLLHNNLSLAAELSIRVEQINGNDISVALAEYAIKNQITEIVIGHSPASLLKIIPGGQSSTNLSTGSAELMS